MTRPPTQDLDTAQRALHFGQLDRTILSDPADTVFQSARRHGVRIVGACGGRGTCGTCAVHVAAGSVERVDAASDDRPLAASNGKRWVRACQVRALSDCSIEVAPRSLAPVVRAEVDAGAADAATPLDACVVNHDLALTAATLSDSIADTDRIRGALHLPDAGFDLFALRQLPHKLRALDWSIRLRLRGDEIIDVAEPGRRALGLAVDLGTTNVAAFLLDLETGARIASLGVENPQVAWGADLISRINHAMHGAAAAAELQHAAVEAINALGHDLCHAAQAVATDIVDVVICGNTAMHHLLLGLPVRQLGRAPFVAALRHACDVKARDLGIQVAPGAYAHVAPNVAGFVGGDHVAALLATQVHWGARTTSVVMDIGTNTEISLMHRGAIFSASSPSGPALEGGHISCGMRAAAGAIERVMLDAQGRIAVRTIGGEDPVGLCGSGVLDALAAMHRSGAVDDRGRIAAAHPDVVHGPDGRRAVQLAPGVLFTQADVRAVQLAKAAIRTALDLLLDQAGLPAEAIGCCVIAGAFGAYIDVGSAIAIGLLPALPHERFLQVGNAAGAGVRMMLVSRQARNRATEIAAGCRAIELSTRGDFQKRFLHQIGLPRRSPPATTRT